MVLKQSRPATEAEPETEPGTETETETETESETAHAHAHAPEDGLVQGYVNGTAITSRFSFRSTTTSAPRRRQRVVFAMPSRSTTNGRSRSG